MFTPAHAGIGWLLAEAGKGDSMFRRWVFLAAVLPDTDGILMFFSINLYSIYHHVWTHNLLFSLLVSGIAVAFCRGLRWRAFLFTQIAFYAHYFGDYFFTLWPLHYFYPFSDITFFYRHGIPLYHPFNYWATIVLTGAVIILSLWLRRSPIEVFSPALDHRVMHPFDRIPHLPRLTRS